MTEQKKANTNQKTKAVVDTNKKAAEAVTRAVFGDKKKNVMKRKKGGFKERAKDEFEQSILDLARVTRVMAGGKRMSFRACVGIGNKKGKIGVGIAKGADVSIAVEKAVNKAKKNIIEVPMVNETIPHEIYQKQGAAKILFKPAAKGRGVIAGGAVRVMLELAGIGNVVSKNLGTSNKINVARCVITALDSFKKVEVKKNQKSNLKNQNEK